MVNKTHPLRVPSATVEKRVSDMVLRYTKERELQKWDKKSRPPRKMMGQRKSASFRNHENGLFIFSVCAIDKVSRLTFLSLVGSYKKGTFLENEKAQRIINHRQDSHFRMEFDESVPICIDGEIRYAKTADFSIRPRALNFVVPNGCEIID